jgi:hypothetical protein
MIFKYIFRNQIKYFKGFYVAYEYGTVNVTIGVDKEVKERLFYAPLQSFFDIFVISLNDLLEAYNYLLYSIYSEVGKVNN